jgi:hypothetical protein
VFPTIRAHYGLTPIRLHPCWANLIKAVSLLETAFFV